MLHFKPRELPAQYEVANWEIAGGTRLRRSSKIRRGISRLLVRRSVRRQRPPGRIGDGDVSE